MARLEHHRPGRYGPLENLRLVERDKPTPGDKDVLIRVRGAGLDPGIWHMMTGRPLMVRIMGLGFSGPKVPVAGWDAAGVVEAVGAGVTRFKVGDEIFGNCDAAGTGTFADYACLPENRCVHRPINLGLEESGALAVSGCTALQALRDAAKLQAGMSVLVIGAAGGVGHYAVQIARAFGAKVTGVCSTSKLDFVRELGAADVIDYTLGDGLGGGARRWDVIVDTAGRRSLVSLRRALTDKGSLTVVGGEGGNAWTGEFIERMLAGAFLSMLSSRKITVVTATVNVADLTALKELVEAGKLSPRIDRRYRLDEAVTGLVEMAKGHSRGKSLVVVEPREPDGAEHVVART